MASVAFLPYRLAAVFTRLSAILMTAQAEPARCPGFQTSQAPERIVVLHDDLREAPYGATAPTMAYRQAVANGGP